MKLLDKLKEQGKAFSHSDDCPSCGTRYNEFE
jgi:hypothetical protein